MAILWIVVCLLPGVLAGISITGTTAILNDVAYYIPPVPVTTLTLPKGLATGSAFIPITILQTTNHISAADFSMLMVNFTTEDDVYQSGFLEHVFIQQMGPASKLSEGSFGLQNYTIISVTQVSEIIPTGPYFMNPSGHLHRAYRLYSDSQGAFTETVIETLDGTYSVLPAGIAGQSLAVAVPSRLYYTKTAEKPLAGVRLGVKDIYDLKGLRTSNGNRAWYKLYPEAENTAYPVQKLIDAGAIVVGKMVTSQFANGEIATADWVDYHAPFNPRGDGYQDAGSSSAGAGAGEGAYSWLDISLGSDTGGSIRLPSQVQGLYGNRPSTGIVKLDHTMSMAPQLDTAGLLTKDPILWAAAAKAMYGDNITFTNNYPSTILAIGWPESPTKPGDKLLIDFLATVSRFISANVTALNLTESWSATGPVQIPYTELLNLTYPILISQNEIKSVRDPFYRDYGALHDGRLPAVDPVPLIRWVYGESSPETIETAVANKTLFMNWFNEKVLPPNTDTCSSSLIVYVGGQAATTYRNLYRPTPSPPWGLDPGSTSIFAEVPDMVVPIGETSYFSSITNHTEFLPVTVDIMAAKGCDGLIFSLVADLYKAGIVKKSTAGYSSTTGGDILVKKSINAFGD